MAVMGTVLFGLTMHTDITDRTTSHAHPILPLVRSQHSVIPQIHTPTPGSELYLYTYRISSSSSMSRVAKHT